MLHRRQLLCLGGEDGCSGRSVCRLLRSEIDSGGIGPHDQQIGRTGGAGENRAAAGGGRCESTGEFVERLLQLVRRGSGIMRLQLRTELCRLRGRDLRRLRLRLLPVELIEPA